MKKNEFDDKTEAIHRLDDGLTINQYQIIKKIGAGGMGEVYLAHDTQLDRDVALKFLPAKFANIKEHRERFIREAKASARLNHPNIVTVYEVGEFNKRPFIALEYVSGNTLYHHIHSDKIRPQQVITIAEQVLEGLAEAHDYGIVHRDIKPSNIILDKKGRARILDFGLAVVADNHDLTAAGTTLGTINYMSPEQVEGKQLDFRTDLFSFGIVLYELLTGQTPFRKDSSAASMYAIVHEEPLSIASYNISLSAFFEQIIERLLQKNRELRCKNIRDILDMIKHSDDTVSIKAAKPTEENRSVAVLPFENMSSDQEQEYFSDGITEEIINALAQLNNLKVAARRSTFLFKGKDCDIKEIGDTLKVNTVLEGAIRRSGNKIRISAQLINVSDGYTIWSEIYNRDLDDMFAVQEDIAKTIALKLKISLSGSSKNMLVKQGTDNLQAYDLYLRGKFYWEQRGKKLNNALQFFNEAIALDPNYGLAYVGLADCYHMMGLYGNMPPEECMPKAKENANKALQLDNSLAGAYTALAMVNVFYDYNWDAAYTNFNKAIEINPHYVQARYWYALWYLFLYKNDTDEAINQGKISMEIDPLSALPAIHYAFILWMTGKTDQVIKLIDRIEETDPLAFKSYWWLTGACALETGDIDKALAVCPKPYDVSRRHQWSNAFYGYIQAKAGNIKEAEQVFVTMRKQSETSYISPFALAITPVALGRIDEALDILDRTRERKDCAMLLTSKWPMYAEIQEHPRFKALLTHFNIL